VEETGQEERTREREGADGAGSMEWEVKGQGEGKDDTMRYDRRVKVWSERSRE